MDRLSENNLLVMELFSALLHERACPFTKEEVEGFARDVGMDCHQAFCALVCAVCGLDSDLNPRHRLIVEKYIGPALKKMDTFPYKNDPFYQNVRLPEKTLGEWQLTHQQYAPYEMFCYDDPMDLPDGREIPCIGYFTETFRYPAVLQKGRLWMAITPNEVETMREDIAAAHGNILVLGLGLGYYAYMTAQMENVSRVTVVELDENVIRLFEEELLPQFPHREKIRVIHADAFSYVEKEAAKEKYDFVYADIWHDVLDGTPMYVRFKALEGWVPGAEWRYWVEKSMLIWLRGLIREEMADGKGKLFDLFAGEQMENLSDLDVLRQLAGRIPPDFLAPEK
ncbi:MAG: hypothetical protein IJN44_02540 [Clostridia bacterium]|nr:hypothetical protein [Clostridia bacterium]